MAKDPAFLFYPNDYIGGTMGMSFEEKGCYMELLMMQFNQGKFTEAQAKQVLSICFTVAWPVLKLKFESDGTYYWNKRLADEIEKRKRFSESRRLNGLGTKKTKASAKHMPKHMEDENRNEDIIKIEDEYIFLKDKDFKKAWDEFKQMRVKMRKPLTDRAIKTILNKVDEFSKKNNTLPVQLIDKSLEKGWLTVYEPDQEKPKSIAGA